jgi:dihydroorotate dehydrogenase (NAD+) catalytic subunit
VKPVGLRAVYDLHAALDIPVIGVGGICGHKDAIEYLMAGASAFQIGSAIGRNINVFSEVNEGISKFMEEFGYSSIEKMIGAAHE